MWVTIPIRHIPGPALGTSHPKISPIMILLLILHQAEISTHKATFWGQTIIMLSLEGHCQMPSGRREWHIGHSTQTTISLIFH